ncbi:MAG TPA: hypothetical protein DEF47_21320 [Herpetosiphon sp.]|uniref:Uncharacterized protein n=1 Tax=Herpetosiphon aurantiacus (strain ATCC 23779 / DSM 785 / 114-95) TaxID=316274 RepID=A9B156_HERA2|nr:hypothetical protein [Herpetosiphon sp.]ABX05334.1 hypothetical protein Haur_2696 [Herpetosiphon aurantiacus DSM 785]HBW52432.1 hypothetical protein [Herpetosiphon sp.]
MAIPADHELWLTAYCFQSNNHQIIAAAVRTITQCHDQAPTLAQWQATQPFAEQVVQGMPTSYHIAPAEQGWVLVYPNRYANLAFASSLSRQSRKLTIAYFPDRREAWERGHPADLPSLPDFGLLDCRYFSQLIQPPVADWSQWIHLWHPRWIAPSQGA